MLLIYLCLVSDCACEGEIKTTTMMIMMMMMMMKKTAKLIDKGFVLVTK